MFLLNKSFSFQTLNMCLDVPSNKWYIGPITWNLTGSKYFRSFKTEYLADKRIPFCFCFPASGVIFLTVTLL